jgi:hypothetical protein
MNARKQRQQNDDHDEALHESDDRAEPPRRFVQVLEKHGVGNGEQQSVDEMKTVTVNLRAVTMRREHRAHDEWHVDARDAESLSAGEDRRQHHRSGESPQKHGWQVQRVPSPDA